MIHKDIDYLVSVADKYKDLPEAERLSGVYFSIKEKILKYANVTRTISKGDMIFLKAFLEADKCKTVGSSELLLDFERTFGKYLKGEYDQGG
jgi:hypothetical protein